MLEEEQVASHSEDVPETTSDPVSEALSLFGIEVTTKEDEAITDEPDEREIDEEEPPATEEPKNTRKVKYNKKEVEIAEDQIDELLEKGLALDKVRDKSTKYESALTRAAKLAGYDKVDEYLTNLDTIEQQAIQSKKDDFESIREQLREEAEGAGLDPARLDEWLDNHPVLNKAQEILQREQQAQNVQKQEQEQQLALKGWEDLFSKYPDLAVPEEDGQPVTWYTPEIQSKIARGYDPIDAYELVNRDNISLDQRKRTEQDVLKQQRLNKRSSVLGTTAPNVEPAVPKEVSDAFSIFGLDPKAAQKYYKK